MSESVEKQDKYREKIICAKCGETFCFRVYRYKHIKNCNGNSKGNIFENPMQPIRNYNNKNMNEREEEEKEKENVITTEPIINLPYKVAKPKPIIKDNIIIRKDYSSFRIA
jgi:hypothetical protein